MCLQRWQMSLAFCDTCQNILSILMLKKLYIVIAAVQKNWKVEIGRRKPGENKSIHFLNACTFMFKNSVKLFNFGEPSYRKKLGKEFFSHVIPLHGKLWNAIN